MNHLRPMKPEDAKILAEWEKNNRPYPWTEKNFTDSFHAAAHFVLVWDGDAGPNGFAVIQKSDDQAYIQNLMVDPARYRQGLGTQLLQMLLDWCRGNGIATVKLDVDERNSPAVHLYERAGFHVIGTRQNVYPRGETGHVMIRDLSH